MFSLPTFNLSCNVWHGQTFTPFATPVGPPDVADLECNLAFGKRVQVLQSFVPAAGQQQTIMELLLPPLSDVRSPVTDSVGGTTDAVECPAGSGRYYLVLGVDDAGKGFANEHRIAVLLAWGPWPSPIP